MDIFIQLELFLLLANFRKLLIAHQKLKEGSLKKHVDKSPRKTDLTFECKFYVQVIMCHQKGSFELSVPPKLSVGQSQGHRESSEPIKTQSKYG